MAASPATRAWSGEVTARPPFEEPAGALWRLPHRLPRRGRLPGGPAGSCEAPSRPDTGGRCSRSRLRVAAGRPRIDQRVVARKATYHAIDPRRDAVSVDI